VRTIFLDDPDSHLLFAGIALVVLVAIISVFETALANINRPRLKQLSADGSKEATALGSLLQMPLDILIVIKTWHALALLLFGIFAGFWLHVTLKSWSGIAGMVLCLAMVIFIEIVIARLAPQSAEKIALPTVRFLTLLHKLSSPFIGITLFVISPLTKFTDKNRDSKTLVTEDEIKLMVEEASLQGVLEEKEKEMIHSVFELSDTIAKEIMAPRMDIVAAEINTPLTKVLDMAINNGLSRIPIFEESIDKVIGIVHTKDLLSLLKEKKMDTPVKDIIRPAYFIPGSKKIDEMLREMQKEKVAMAIVIDEYGGTDGLVTIEDIIEEIVGEITDEYDKEIRPIEQMDDGSYVIDGKTIIEDVNDKLDLSIPTEEFETVGGYVYGLTGHIPHSGETIHTDSITIVVEKVVRQRITKLRIKKNAMTMAETTSQPG
jgi:putative hemolysin